MDGGEPRKKGRGEMGYPKSAPTILCPAEDLSSNSSATRRDLHEKSRRTPGTPITENTNTSPISAFVITEKYSSVLNGY